MINLELVRFAILHTQYQNTICLVQTEDAKADEWVMTS